MTTGTTISLAIGTNPGGGTLTGGTDRGRTSPAWPPSRGSRSTRPGRATPWARRARRPYPPLTSSAFNILTGPATQLAFAQGPTTTVVGASMTPAVTVAVEDANGNIETGDSGDNRSVFAIGVQPERRHAHRGRRPCSTRRASPPSQVLSIDKVGIGYTLSASSTPIYSPRPRRRPSTSHPARRHSWSSSRAPAPRLRAPR